MKNRNEILAAAGAVIKKHKVLTFGVAAAIAGSVIAGILPPLVLERLINQLTDRLALLLSGANPLEASGKAAAGTGVFVRLIAIWFLLIAAAGIFDAVKGGLITVFGQKVTHRIRKDMCARLSHLPASYYTENEPGVTASRFVNDVDTVETLFTSGIISMFADICKVVSILAVIFVKSKGLGILLLLVIPVLFWMTRQFQKRMLKAQLYNREAVGKANHHVPETIRNIRMIHTFGKESYMEEKYFRYIQESYRSMEKSNFYDAIYSPIVITISAVLVAVMMILSARGGQMQLFFGMSVGTAVAVISYVGKVFEPLESIGMEIQNIQSALAGAERIQEFMRTPERKMPENRVEDQKEKAVWETIVFQQVTFGYEPGKPVLQHCNLSVLPGEMVTLTGRTGAGKSTVFKLLLGLYEPWEGKILIYGKPAAGIDEDKKRKLFGYVEQTFHPISGTVEEQITLRDSCVSHRQVERALELVGMKETVEALENGYDTAFSTSLFSQGQQQLLSIARAVASDPEILLLDEITANLDSSTEETVLTALKNASQNRTVLSISHRLYEETGGRRIEI
ncbi:MAG: ABC transporter ATP-binding protein [Lachnospiraceae bacterium]|nr:ABC transporter ATP-binding protein [Lachnospiraceae bacterium]